jgi:hypothetical protein
MAQALLPLIAFTLYAVDEPAIDVARGRQLMARFKAEETLSAEDQSYLDRVKQATSTAVNTPPVNPADWKALVPITNMTTP